MALTKIKTSGLAANVIYDSIVVGAGITVTANNATQVIITSSGGGSDELDSFLLAGM
jgi:hypothetical protein